MSSGVAVDDEVINVFQELKMGHAHRFAFFKLNDDQSKVIVDKKAPPSTTWDQFVSELPPNDCRYAVYDFPYQHDGRDNNKILFVVWAPDSAKIKSKMLYASTREALRKKLVGIGTEVQATDLSEIDKNYVLERVLRV
jgi:cofilin